MTHFASELKSGFPIDWFVDFPEDFICGFCSNVLNDPLQCKNGHMFCKSCVTNACITSNSCPTCHIAIVLEGLGNNKLAEKQISKLTTNCPCKSDLSRGYNQQCTWTGVLNERLVRDCEFKCRSCSNFGCIVSLPCLALKLLASYCPKRF